MAGLARCVHLWEKCKAGDVGGVIEAIEGGGDPNYSHLLTTCLMVAAEKGHVGVVEELLRQPGIRVNDTDHPFGSTALHEACEWGHAGVVRLLVGHPGVDTQVRDNEGETPLEVAESPNEMVTDREGHTECARILRAQVAAIY